MEIRSHLTVTFNVYWHDTDKSGKMSFAAISRYLQETAWRQAELLGFGYEKAKALNRFWVLVRQRIKMNRFPVWTDMIKIETWARGVDGFWAFRDYLIKDKDGEIIGGAASSWMVIDLTSRRPHKPDLVLDAMEHTDPAMALKEPADRILFEGVGQTMDLRKVKFSDMDNNGHVTNSKYTEWIFDALSQEKAMRNFTGFHINFINEAMEGDEITLLEETEGELIKIKATRNSDGRNIFIAALD